MPTVSASGPSGGPVIEPTKVFGRSDEDSWEDDLDLFHEGGVRLVDETAEGAEDDTAVLDLDVGTGPATGTAANTDAGANVLSDGTADRPGRRRSALRHRARLPLIVAAAVVAGFGLAFLLMPQTSPFRITVQAPAAGTPSAAAPSVSAAAPSASVPAAAVAPQAEVTAAAGVLRQGDTGNEVLDLQTRLLRIPDLYTDGKTDGQYDITLTEAVARFQLWYGIRGDETGEYGDDTRRDLESRT